MQIDRTRPPFRDDPVIAALTDEQIGALVGVIVRLARTYAARLETGRLERDEAAGRADPTEVA